MNLLKAVNWKHQVKARKAQKALVIGIAWRVYRIRFSWKLLLQFESFYRTWAFYEFGTHARMIVANDNWNLNAPMWKALLSIFFFFSTFNKQIAKILYSPAKNHNKITQNDFSCWNPIIPQITAFIHVFMQRNSWNTHW